MNRTSCIVTIQSKLKLLTGSEKKVADYILGNYMEVLDYTVKMCIRDRYRVSVLLNE